LEDAKTWGLLATGTKVVKGEPIYPRFEVPEMVDVVVTEEVEEAVDTSNIPPLKENITYDDFEKLDLRVAKVISCEKVPKSKKLLKFVLDIGIEERTVLSGISQYYEPETMVGKKVIYLSNLAPKKMMGIESYGMILSASDWEEHLEVTNIESLPAGSVVK
jgi:methionine--tRNA ligase, beta subunit